MTHLFSYPYLWLDGTQWTLTHCSWPVIIHDDKVLLHIGASTGKYQFIWWRLDDTLSLQENAIIRAQEVLWHRNISLTWEPLAIIGEISRDSRPETIILFHYKATINNASETGAWEWKTLDEILELEKQDMISSKNIVIASKYFLERN